MGSKSRSRAGIQTCHRTGCANKEGKYCNCKPTYRAEVWSPRDEKKIRKTFSSLAEASAWRADALAELRRGVLRAPTAVTLAQAAEAWLAGAHDGSIRNRSGDVYKPSAIRGYEQALRIRVLPALGKARLADLSAASSRSSSTGSCARATSRRRSVTRCCRCGRSSAARSRVARSP